jgi:polyphosphate kinase 2 (PPK2 family)
MDRQMLKQLANWLNPYRVTDGSKFRLARIDPADTAGLKSESKRQAAQRLDHGVRWLAAEQDKLYAQDRRSLLLVFQAMDAAGKDGTIKHVMSGVNPQGCQVVAFKQPSAEDLDHDWMWRCWKHLPERGRIGIFNRSYYEEVLVVRVHREILAAQKLPPGAITNKIFRERLRDIARFEDYLHRNGTTEKNWKFAAGDVRERALWDDYMAAYEDAIRATATKDSPWFVVPADNKWFTRLIVAGAIVEALEKMDLAYPAVTPAQRADLARAREALLAG